MDHQQSKKRKSAASNDPEITTPDGTPAAKRMKISQSQKQALIDNLQLEITERARHLRAHYALQATDLRSRIERRINRIPVSLRKANMGEILEKYTEVPVPKKIPQTVDSTKVLPNVPATEVLPNVSAAKPLPNVPAVEKKHALPSVAGTNSFAVIEQKCETCSTPKRGAKRRSSDIDILSDKENEPAAQPDQLCNPKNSKRTKTATGGGTRVASRTAKTHPSNILSPKSHNSRTLPRSPIKDPNTPSHSPSKPSYLARPISPLKPVSPLKTAASAATSAISASLHGMVEHAKRGAGTAAAGLRRTESKGKAANNARGKIMAPPARPAAPQQKQPQHDRPASQVSNHSAASSSSMTSSATTVITKKPVRKGKTGLSATTTTRKATCPTTTKVNAMKGPGGAKANGAAAKNTAVAEPAAGRRVLRRRN